MARYRNGQSTEGNVPFAFNGRATRNFLGLLVLMHFILFVDRINLAAAASVMQQDLGLSNIALGIAFSAFNYAYAPFQLVGGWFADRFGVRRTLTVCGLTWSVNTIVTGAVTRLASLFAVRLVLGMGEGATLPAATPALSKWTSLTARGTAVGITHAAGRLGAGAAAPIVAFPGGSGRIVRFRPFPASADWRSQGSRQTPSARRLRPPVVLGLPRCRRAPPARAKRTAKLNI